jgi:manganese transport protein
VNAAILVLAASAFYKNGYNDVVDISNAHELLKGLFGNLAPTLFAIALIAAGQSSTVTGTLAGQIVMEGYLNLRISPWLRRIITRAIAVAPAVFTILYLGEERLGELLILSQVVLSIQLGFAIVPLIHFSSSKAIMGEFRISKMMTIVSWIVAIVIIGLNMKLVIEEVSGFLDSEYGNIFILRLLVLLVVIFAVSLLIWIIAAPLFKKIIHKQIIPHGGAMSLKLKKVESFKNIGIAVDFTSTDMSSISYAIHLGGIKANYVLIHVVESAAARQYEGQVEDSETKADREYLLSYTNELSKKGYNIKPCLGFGNRVEAISKFVKEENTDLLIMGAHGHQTMKDFIFGSTVESVRHKLQIPVLVVK